MLALGRLLRVSLAPSALADIAAGSVLAAGSWPGGSGPFLVMLGSACVYHGGMALNDWADREEDARNARARPIPRGEIRAGTALVLAIALLLAGPPLAWSASPCAGACLGAVALLAAFYDLGGRGPWSGPLLLGLCRAGNLATGLVLGLGGTPGAPGVWLAPIVYGLYVVAVSRLARLEDQDAATFAATRPGRWLALAALVLAALGLLPFARDALESSLGPATWERTAIALAVSLAGAIGLAGYARRKTSWAPRDVVQAAGMALRRLLVASASIAAGAGTRAGLLVGAFILLGYPLSYGLRKLFPPS